MTKNTKTLLALIAFIIFLAAAGIIYSKLAERHPAENPFSTLGQQTQQAQDPEDESDTSPNPDGEEEKLMAPDFTAVDGDGNEIRLSDYRGVPVVLNFWASWCGPCRSEMPTFNKVSREYTGDQLVFLMVDLVDGQRETLETGKQYIDENGFTFRVLYDTKQEGAYSYGIRSIPSTLFIDKDGYVLAGYEGAMSEEILRLGIDLIIETE